MERLHDLEKANGMSLLKLGTGADKRRFVGGGAGKEPPAGRRPKHKVVYVAVCRDLASGRCRVQRTSGRYLKAVLRNDPQQHIAPADCPPPIKVLAPMRQSAHIRRGDESDPPQNIELANDIAGGDPSLMGDRAPKPSRHRCAQRVIRKKRGGTNEPLHG